MALDRMSCRKSENWELPKPFSSFNHVTLLWTSYFCEALAHVCTLIFIPFFLFIFGFPSTWLQASEAKCSFLFACILQRQLQGEFYQTKEERDRKSLSVMKRTAQTGLENKKDFQDGSFTLPTLSSGGGSLASATYQVQGQSELQKTWPDDRQIDR